MMQTAYKNKWARYVKKIKIEERITKFLEIKNIVTKGRVPMMDSLIDHT